MNNNIYLGSHVNLSGPDYYLGTVRDAISMGENTFMFYTGAPQNTVRKPTNELKIEEGYKLLIESGINPDKIVIHAPYIINLGNTTNPNTRQLAISFLKQELIRVNDFHVKTLVLHPGSHVGAGLEVGIKAVIDGLNEVLDNDNSEVKIALETMAGKGSEIGSRFEQLKSIIDGIHKKDRVGVCLDTCHISDGGYNVHDVDGVINEFDRIVGLNKLLCVHINDSMNPNNSHKDRHANIGYGQIGFDTLYKYVNHPKLNEVPKELETPWINEKPPYKKEIEMLRNNTFEKDWINLL